MYHILILRFCFIKLELINNIVIRKLQSKRNNIITNINKYEVVIVLI